MNVHAADSFMASLGVPEVYRVGGSVRDEKLGRKPKDLDYVVRGIDLDGLRSELFMAASPKVAKITPLKLRDGRKIGLRASIPHIGTLEIALPRTERSTGPGRHDFEIVTSPYLLLEEDAQRRDFTINALYYDPRSYRTHQPLGMGTHDIQCKTIRTTHKESFRDDPLRILRAARFLATLPGGDWMLSDETAKQMAYHANAVTGLTVKGVSGTAFDELCKLLMGRWPSNGLCALRDWGPLDAFLPELTQMIFFDQESKYHELTIDMHTFRALDAAAGMHCNLRVRLALLFHDAGKPYAAWRGEDGRLHYYSKDGSEDHAAVGARLARAALDRLNAPRKLRNDVVTLVERHMVSLSGKIKKAKVRRWRVELGDELLCDLFKHRLADTLGKGSVDYDAIRALSRLEEIRAEAERQDVPTSVKDLDGIDGHFLMAQGLAGPQIGRVLDKLLHEVISQPNLNNREWLTERARVHAAKELRMPKDAGPQSIAAEFEGGLGGPGGK